MTTISLSAFERRSPFVSAHGAILARVFHSIAVGLLCSSCASITPIDLQRTSRAPPACACTSTSIQIPPVAGIVHCDCGGRACVVSYLAGNGGNSVGMWCREQP